MLRLSVENKKSSQNIDKIIINLKNIIQIIKEENKPNELSNNNNNLVVTEITYENGDIYKGETKNGIRTGKGTIYFSKNNDKNRVKYEGEWKNDLINGKGKMFWNNGDIYEGSFLNDQKDGKGIYIFEKGDIFEGDFKNGAFHNQGSF